MNPSLSPPAAALSQKSRKPQLPVGQDQAETQSAWAPALCLLEPQGGLEAHT